MRNFILVAGIFLTLVFFACGNKKETTENVDDTDSGVIDETLDTSNTYGSIISDGLSDESGIIDSSKKEPMVYIDKSNEIQVDPPVTNKENVKITETVKEEPKVKTHEKRFYVVAGSFKKYSNAQNLYDLFKKKGYQPLILPKMSGYNRVAIVSYSQEKEARKALSKLRTENGDITFWLFKW